MEYRQSCKPCGCVFLTRKRWRPRFCVRFHGWSFGSLRGVNLAHRHNSWIAASSGRDSVSSACSSRSSGQGNGAEGAGVGVSVGVERVGIQLREGDIGVYKTLQAPKNFTSINKIFKQRKNLLLVSWRVHQSGMFSLMLGLRPCTLAGTREARKEGRNEGRQKGRKEGGKEGRKQGRKDCSSCFISFLKLS